MKCAIQKFADGREDIRFAMRKDKLDSRFVRSLLVHLVYGSLYRASIPLTSALFSLSFAFDTTTKDLFEEVNFVVAREVDKLAKFKVLSYFSSLFVFLIVL